MAIANSSTIRKVWTDAHRKVEEEGKCRVCGAGEYLEPAHVIGQKCDPVLVGPKGGEYKYVHPDAIVPLCGSFSEKNCHSLYDRRTLDLLPYLNSDEEERAVHDARGIISALKRVSPMGGSW